MKTRFSIVYVAAFALALLLGAPPVAERLSAHTAHDGAQPFTAAAQKQEKRHYDYDDELPERDTFDQSYQLAPGAQVRVNGINGAVTIETSNTSTAEVHIIRSARTRADLERHRVIVEQTASGLYIHSEKTDDDDRRGERRGGDVRQRVSLRVPRQIDLQASGINGRVGVGEVDGPVRLSGINGSTVVAQARGYSEISGINGSVTVTIAQLGERGIRVSGVNGAVELRFADALNADLHVNGINGSVYADVPNVTVQGRVNRSNFNAQIGTGGAPINVSGVNGHVRLSPRG